MSLLPIAYLSASPAADTVDANADQIGVCLADADDIDSILDLNKSEYGPTDILVTPADFIWRHDQNPAGQALIPVIKNSANQVVGCIWIVPLRIRIKGSVHLGATGTNLLIHPQYRNSFVYTKLMRQFNRTLKKQNFPLHFSFVSEDEYQRRRRHNPETAWTVPLLVKPLSVSLLAQSNWGRRWPGRLVKPIDRLASLFSGQHRSKHAQADIEVRAVDQVDESFDRFWHNLQDKYPVMLIRDQAFLAWRFTNISHRQYQIFVAQKEAEMLGYLVLRCTTVRGIRTGLVLDFLVLGNALGEEAGARLLAQAESYFREQQMAVTMGLVMPSAVEYRLLRQAGYIGLPSKLSPRPFRFAFFVHNKQTVFNSLPEQDWFITLADYESF